MGVWQTQARRDKKPTTKELVEGENFRSLPLDRLRIDERLRFPIHGPNGVLLLAADSVVTSRTLEALRQRGFDRVLIHREETAAQVPIEPSGSAVEVPDQWSGVCVPVESLASRRLDRALVDTVRAALKEAEPPFLAEVPDLGTTPYEESLSRELYQTHEHCVSALRSVQFSIMARQAKGHLGVRQLLADYLGVLVKDLDLFASFATAPHASHYPYRHSLHVAMLSLAMAARAGWGQKALEAVGLGAVLHDVGMLKIARSIWSQRGPLSVVQRLDVMKHPIHSLDAVEGLDDVSNDVRCIMYQVHERAGGQGYPRQVPGELIHPLAKIVAVADAYVAMVSDRPYRPAILPYKAMEAILRQVRAGLFEAEPARLLLETLSLYPVGSYVCLSDGRLGKIVRSNGPTYDRPVARLWPSRTPPSDHTGQLVDLRAASDLKVVEAVPAPPE